MKPYKGIFASQDFITAGELKKILNHIPDDYEVIWSNQFEGVNETIGVVAADDLSKRLYFATFGVGNNNKESLDGLRKMIFSKEWRYLANYSDNDELKDKAKKRLEEL